MSGSPPSSPLPSSFFDMIVQFCAAEVRPEQQAQQKGTAGAAINNVHRQSAQEPQRTSERTRVKPARFNPRRGY